MKQKIDVGFHVPFFGLLAAVLCSLTSLLALPPFVSAGRDADPPNPGSSADEPGLVITGHVRLDGGAGSGLPGVTVFRSYAAYAGVPAATTDADGYYESAFAFIPGDEMVSVWAARAGYTVNPPQYFWRHYYSYERRTLDFFARPLVTDCAAPPIPARLIVYDQVHYTSALTYDVAVYLAHDGPLAAPALITVSGEAGAVTRTSDFSSANPLVVTIPLLPYTTHHVSVKGLFTEADGCRYETFSAFDERGYALIIEQRLPGMLLPVIARGA